MSSIEALGAYYEKKICRLCKLPNLALALDLGHTFLADEFLTYNNVENEDFKFPLKLNSCMDCGWLQTSIVVNPVRLYQNEYPYDSSTTKTGFSHWRELASSLDLYRDWGIDKKSLDIGANVGVLVESFSELGFDATGVDPSLEACNVGINYGRKILNNFFDFNFAQSLKNQGLSFDVITATNVFAHIDDLDDWMLGISEVLKANGTLVVEAPYALNLINALQFDTIYHEHLSYVSLKPLLAFFAKFNMEINHVEERPIHGGSLRIFVSRFGVNPVRSSVSEILKKEASFGINSLQTLTLFNNRVMELISEVKDFALEIARKGQKLVVISAPAKGMTFLNVTELKKPLVIGISDVAKQKYGRYAPGTGLKVMTDKELANMDPDFAIILAWNFADEIISNVRFLYSKKTKFFVCIPTLEEI